ncbi:hypothetical protein LUZ60_007188 [Juncus effusus]|nr:hypothetical protein LUZ60_007188 [Juncus effusus]
MPTNSMISSNWKPPNLLTITIIALLCSFSYLISIYHHSSPPLSIPSLSFSPPSCNLSSPSLPSNSTTTLDFSLRHPASESDISPKHSYLFPPCDKRYIELTPCEGQRRSLKFPRFRLEYRQRHCPNKDEKKKFNCLVPAPKGYKVPFRWPESRDVAWFANAPHMDLVEEKGVQNWIKKEGEVFAFPGGGTMFSGGADRYLDEIGKVVPIGDGSVRTAVDTGCGVASFGAYLQSRNIITMSFAPKDTHEAQVLFALERGVPAMIGILATIRLSYPSRAFDMAHCSRCLIPWHLYDGQYLIEIDRILRPGGYWILSGPPINWQKHYKGWKRTTQDLNSEQEKIESITKELCWIKLHQEGDIAIWQKPIDHSNCKANKMNESQPLDFCTDQDPDLAWYAKLQTCITKLPDFSPELKKWPERLNSLPPRIIRGDIEGISAELFYNDSELWRKRIKYYKSLSGQLAERGRFRNLLDMNAGLGGFSAALNDEPVWVMNVVPTISKLNTLGVIYERGLIGTYQDWCEAMSTYPRTYDLLHADSLFTLYNDQCEIEEILLEMDRILRPEGTVIIRDDVDLIVKIKQITDGMRWQSRIANHEDGPLKREKILVAVKSYWTL